MAKEVLASVSILPTEKDIKVISPVIEGLAEKYDSTPFVPHITVWGNVIAPLEEIEEAARYAVEGIKPFQVEIEELGYSERWSKTLFAQFKHHEALIEIHRRLGEKFRRFGDYTLNPHLSLIYKREMTEEEKLKEILGIVIPNQISIDTIVVTTPTDPVAKWENLSAWENPVEIKFNS